MKIIFLKIYQCTPYLKVPFRIPVKYKVTKAHKIEIPGQIYTQRQLIICFIYTRRSVQDLCNLYHTTNIPLRTAKLRVENCLENEWALLQFQSFFPILVRILFGCLLGNLVHLHSFVMPRISSFFFVCFFCFFVSVF